MKGETWLTGLQSAVLTFLLSFFPLACLTSAFSFGQQPYIVSLSVPMELPPWVALDQLALWCALLAVVLSACLGNRLWPLPLAALLVAGLVYRPLLEQSLEGVVAELTRYYDLAYGTGVLRWSEGPLQQVNGTWALCAFAALSATMCAWTICRRKPALLCLPVCLLPLLACLVVTDTVPEVRYLFAVFAAVALLLLTQGVRRRSGSQGNRLFLYALVPVFLAAVLLFALVPQSTYAGQDRADAVLQQLQQWLGVAPQGQQETTVTVSAQENLAGMGIRNNPHTPVLELTTQADRTYYLREQGFDTYDGLHWFNTKSIDITEAMEPQYYSGDRTVTITTVNPQPIQFVPYYVTDRNVGGANGATANPDRLRTYEFQVQGLGIPVWGVSPTGEPPDACRLPEATLQWARPLALELTKDAQTTFQKAQIIREYVQGCARYDLRTDRMPADREDFARWFLFESDTGYCVHYATATAVLLRAIDIPAQYVTGYVAQVQGGSATVCRDNAHAWVEYYLPGVGWDVLDSTPEEYRLTQGQTQEQTLPTVDTAPTESPSQSQQTPDAQPTEPAEVRPTTPQQEEKTAEAEAETWPWWLLGGVSAVLFLLLQWRLRLWCRDRRLRRGTANQQALACWQQAQRLSRLTGLALPLRLLELAQKARFSQHRLTGEELAQFHSYFAQARDRAAAAPLLRRLLLRLVYALY